MNSGPLDLKQLLVCPGCRGSLTWSADEARCQACAGVYPIVDGIPSLLPPATVPGRAAPDRDDHKAQQAALHDEQDPEFEISRPHGAPRLYRWLIGEKFRRSVVALDGLLPGSTALTVCGGSGMDAEYLARAGAQVIASDLSLGAVQRTQERARRYGLAIMPLVADVEQLPFRDEAVDVVYVHDGLHHLEDPAKGLAEMARVASHAVSVTEPARAALTALAVRLGLALEQEEVGNRVARMTRNGVSDELRIRGFRVVHAGRYAMYYRHKPGTISAALSLPGVFAATCAGWRLVNGLVGRFGNKLTVQARRDVQNGRQEGRGVH